MEGLKQIAFMKVKDNFLQSLHIIHDLLAKFCARYLLLLLLSQAKQLGQKSWSQILDLQPKEDHGFTLHIWKNALNLKDGIHLSFERMAFKQHCENSENILVELAEAAIHEHSNISPINIIAKSVIKDVTLEIPMDLLLVNFFIIAGIIQCKPGRNFA